MKQSNSHQASFGELMQHVPRNRSAGLACFSLLALGTASCFGPGNISSGDLTARERSVRVLQGGEKPDCEYTQLGTVEATSGSALEMGTYSSSVAKMQRDAAAMGGNGLIVLDHSKNQMADQTTGMAIRCR
jgi:hypothetical protein